MEFIESKYVKEINEITSNIYRLGWGERNGGNISYLIDENEIQKYFPNPKFLKDFELDFAVDPILYGKYFLTTGAGKYFKNIAKDPENNLGLVKIDEKGHVAHLLWGFNDGGVFTSEFPAHLMSHAARLKVNPNHKVIVHTHPTYTIAMGSCLPVDENIMTRKLWTFNTEAIVVFPEGVGVLPCMVCGTEEIGLATAEKMKEYRLVMWTNHGIYGAGNNIDEAFGLIETVEKTAQIYMLSLDHAINVIPDEVLKGLAKRFNLKIKNGIIKE